MTGRTFSSSAWRTISFQLGELLDDRDDLLADLAGEHGHLDELVVLEAVADDRRVQAVGQGQHGQQFGLGAGLQAEVERLAEVEDLLDDVPLLVDLDRVDAAVVALVVVLARWPVWKASWISPTRWRRMSVKRSRIGSWMPRAWSWSTSSFRSMDWSGRLFGLDGDVAGLVDAEVALAPVADAVGLDGVLHSPLVQQVLLLYHFGHQRCLPAGARGSQPVGFTT